MHRLLRVALIASSLVAPPRLAAAADAAARAGAPARAPSSDEEAEQRIRAVEARVDELKERVLRTKARLQTLEEMVAGRAGADVRRADATARAPRAGERSAPAPGGGAR